MVADYPFDGMQEHVDGSEFTYGPLPDFQAPPVNEVVFGVLSEPIGGFTMSHFGRFWERVKDAYPNCQEAPPLLPSIETFGERAATINVELSEVPLPRVWLVSKSGNELIQLQRDRFHHNWRRVRPDDVYPRYPSVRSSFESALEAFSDFLDEFGLKRPRALQYELTYINHIPLLGEASLATEIPKILRDFSWDPESRFVTEADQFSSALAFLMPEGRGRLHILARLGQHRETGERVLSLELVARGMPASASSSDMWGWFDLAHEWIVRGFADLTEEQIQTEVWRRVR